MREFVREGVPARALSDLRPVAPRVQRVFAEVSQVIVGNGDTIQLLLIALLSQGHVLIEDVPGVGKTMLARTFAATLGCDFRRMQFTPDVLPSDVTGSSVFNQRTSDFEIRKGPIFTNVVLADEINRATPRTQSSLLEAMEERQVTIDGQSMPLPVPFLVLATENPIELEGTFPLPEAQLDRFLVRASLGYPSAREESEILARFMRDNPLDQIEAVLSADDVSALQRMRSEVTVAEAVREYIVAIARQTRVHDEVILGASPRGELALMRAAQARALISERDFVTPDDVKALALAVLAHRLVVAPRARLRGVKPEAVVEEILASTPVPVETVDSFTEP